MPINDTHPGSGDRLWLESVIVVTGGVVLALELLASRIMTPYFGVSLFIWASILSTTLAFLAVGYAWGGRLCRRSEQLTYLFFLSPTLSAAAITGVCFLYPWLLPQMVHLGLVLGTFVACILLLGPSLVLLAAMNPILVAIRRRGGGTGAEPAGRVYFLSTLGSVAGVVITAFVFIPWMTNFNAMLTVALLMAGVAALGIRGAASARARDRRALYLTLSVTALAAAGLLAGKESYLEWTTPRLTGQFDTRIKAEYSSVYGNVKVVEVRPRAAPDQAFLGYFQDGLPQNRATHDGISISPYTYALEHLSLAYAPALRRVLVLGLGAGIVPRNLARRGIDVTVVDINKDALAAATGYFHFAPQDVRLRWEDARTFVSRCERSFDVAVVDVFQGDHAPDHLFSVEFFRDLAGCIGPAGVVVMNTLLDGRFEASNDRLRATLARSFDHVIEYQMPEGNTFLVATSAPPPVVAGGPGPLAAPELTDLIARTMASGRDLDVARLRTIPPITDENNDFSLLFAQAQMSFRRQLAELLPPRVLLN